MYQIIYGLHIVGLIISGLCILLVATQKPSREQQTALLMTVLAGVSMFGYCFVLQSTTLESMVFAYKIIFLGRAFVYFVTLRFYMEFFDLKLRRWCCAVLFAVSAAIMFVTLTFNRHSYLFRSVYLDVVEGFPVMVTKYGPLFIPCMIITFFYVITFPVIAITHMRHQSKWYKYSVMGILFATFSSLIMNVMSHILKTPFDLTPLGIVPGQIALLLLIYKLNIYDINDTVREMTYNSMDSAIVIVDEHYRFKGCNPLARTLFPALKHTSINQNIDSTSYILYELLHQGGDSKITHKGHVYYPEVKTLYSKGKLSGYALWLKDVTKQIEHTQLLENYQHDLEFEVNRKTEQLRRIQENMLISFSNIVESRDDITGQHIRRTSTYVDILIKQLVKEGKFKETLTESYEKHVRLTAPLHDFGKLAISDRILNKPGKLTPEEFETMKTHTIVGGKILDEILSTLEDKEYYRLAKNMALYHHEHWDGKGYPKGLKGEEIPLCARIMAIVDVFDALVSKRPYKEAYSFDKAFGIIEEERGHHFDPVITDSFLAIREELEECVKEMNISRNSKLLENII